ncbi:ChrR family anti-sigma-E factor [Primorskyibacter sp. S87]|uniref:ChrR family anti-sigma-E factor n=1 Tax=Primorskyibacter sp. S87 TaxID=3415126 RepID=UPI003C7D6C35
MSAITHHTPEAMLAAYAAGTLPHAFSVVVATHVSLCDQCRTTLAAHQAVGGAILDDMDSVAVSGGLRSALMQRLDEPFSPEPVYDRSGIYPGPVMEALKGEPPRWKTLGMGVRQSILSSGGEGSVRLLFIPPGQAVPDHTHNGLELTLVLQGSFSDETGRFGVGDLEIGDESLHHTPTADPGDPCICLAATDAPLSFNAFLPRLLQPIFKI